MIPITPENIPEHVAIIMDGNGRWAKKRRMPRIFGHRKGAERVRDVVEAAMELGVKALTLYTFSEENWQRPREEVSALFSLLNSYLSSEIKELHEKNIKLSLIGNIEKLPIESQKALKDALALTQNNTAFTLTLALSYSSRSELVLCCQKLAAMAQEGQIQPEDITVETISSFLDTRHLPDPDLLIRTSGELRISNFLLWQMAYTEFYFTEVYWPDFSKNDFLQAIAAYQQRQRRFGQVYAATKLAKKPTSYDSDPVGGALC